MAPGMRMEGDVDDFYSKYITSQQARQLTPGALAELRHVIKKFIPADRTIRILDAGCGGGELISLLKSVGYEDTLGIDISGEQIERATAIGLGPHVQHGDIFEFLKATASSSFDVIVAFDLIEHFNKQNAVAFFTHVLRVLKDNGRLIVHVPNGESPFFGAVRYGDFTHELGFTRKSIRQVALTVGFSSCQSYEDAPVAHGLKSSLRSFLWMPCRFILRTITATETGDTGGIFTRNLVAVLIK
jgi:cyclopropane fatty-acyl-phospholipid synthase-like methyltransferase